MGHGATDRQDADPVTELGVTPAQPQVYWGWGVLPDQHGRAWDGDDGGSSGRSAAAGGVPAG